MSITNEEPNRVGASFRWLHFSDIHVGVGGQAQLWPRFGTILLDDLERLLSRTGSVDLIIFSGDLAQMGAAEEFEQFDEIMGEILDRIAQSQNRPKIITVPGNHDLVRPTSVSPYALALKQFWHDRDLREAICDESSEDYRSFISEIFGNYARWQKKSIERGVHLAPDAIGFLPGDATYVVKTCAGRLGIAALNSTWLQVGGGDYLGQLHVDVRQLHRITNGRPDEWTRSNDTNILVTHHPAKWLHSTSPASWDNDINPPGRFDLHLFGHMHEPDTASTAHGGGLPRRDVQAASLFGLERFGDDQHKRIQGYSANCIRISGEERALISWPRRLVPLTDGRMKLAPDSGQDIDEATGSFSIPYTMLRRAAQASVSVPATIGAAVPAVDLGAASTFDLTAIHYAVGDARAHRKVRRVEQETCLEALRQERVVWLASDWGMGQEGFIAALRDQLEVPNDRIYSIDFSDYTSRETFFDNLSTRFGVSFHTVCEAVADAGSAILVLDDVNLNLSAAAEAGIEADIEGLARTVADFASEAFILIRSRRPPRLAHFHVIEMKALDEADVAIYARESEIGGERYGKPDAASTLLRHTDGIPTRLDAALRDLEIISLGDLASSNPDFAQSGGNLTAAPPALVAAMEYLQQSSDRAEQRAYDLLLALAALPQGEQLTRLKRFLGPHPFGPMHARTLLERSLIASMPLTTLDGIPNAPDSKALVVPRPVRDYVRETIGEKTAKSIDRKALDLYFGKKWASGDIRNSPTDKRVRSALCDGYEIQNAGTIIQRTTRRALDSGTKHDIETSVRLALAFIDALVAGEHFRSAAGLCEDIVRLLEETDGFDKEVSILRYEYARSLRMVGRIREASVTFQALDQSHLSKRQRQSAELGLALCLDQLAEHKAAVQAAQRTIAIDRNSLAALQAQAILADQIEDAAARQVELQRLLAVAKRKKSLTIANNIMLVLARDRMRLGKQSDDILKQVVQNSRANADFYNGARAIVALARQPGGVSRLSAEERQRLVEAYHFLYNERLYDLFDRCHAALWDVFERDGDRANLLNLFRHSSFIWRLNEREAQEATYLAKLVKNVHDLIATGLAKANRDGAYFVVRVSVVLGRVPSSSENNNPEMLP